jgi:hypothetical protein
LTGIYSDLQLHGLARGIFSLKMRLRGSERTDTSKGDTADVERYGLTALATWNGALFLPRSVRDLLSGTTMAVDPRRRWRDRRG